MSARQPVYVPASLPCRVVVAGEYDCGSSCLLVFFLVCLAGASKGHPEHRLEASRIHFSAIRCFLAPPVAKRRL